MQCVERLLPLAAMHERVPVRDDIADRAAGVALTEWNAAVHAPRALFAQARLRHGLVELAPMPNAALHGLAFWSGAPQREKRGSLSHCALLRAAMTARARSSSRAST